MEQNQDRKSRKQKSRQIVGFSLSPELAATVKVEAASRSLSLKGLFEEMWSVYKKNSKN